MGLWCASSTAWTTSSRGPIRLLSVADLHYAASEPLHNFALGGLGTWICTPFSGSSSVPLWSMGPGNGCRRRPAASTKLFVFPRERHGRRKLGCGGVQSDFFEIACGLKPPPLDAEHEAPVGMEAQTKRNVLLPCVAVRLSWTLSVHGPACLYHL